MSPRPDTSTLATQRKNAKIGMAVALGTLVGTGFMAHMFEKDKAGLAHLVHVAAGISLVGFSYWHWTLYQRSGTGTGRGRRV